MDPFSGKLEKALFYVEIAPKKEEKVEVQFNPSEISLSRSVRMTSKKALAKDAEEKEKTAATGGEGVLRLSLHFDSYTPLTLKEQQAAVKDAVKKGEILENKVNNVCQKFAELIRYNPELHTLPTVRFVWGKEIEFQGKVGDTQISYTMFEKDGTPVRAKLDITIYGDEKKAIIGAKTKPNESPDRTKERFLPYGEQLWSLAYGEYGDPAMWKEIAAANDILNPRMTGRGTTLRVPSLR